MSSCRPPQSPLPTILALLLAALLLGGPLMGCNSKAGKYDNRIVRGPVLPIPPQEDVPANDLLIVNWAPVEDTDTFYLTYVFKENGRPKVRWERALSEHDGWHHLQATFDQEAVYYVAGDRLLSLSRRDGSTRWETPLSDLVWADCPNCLDKVGDRLIVLTVDYVLQGIDPRDGAVRWSVRLNDSSTAYEGFRVTGDAVALVDYLGPDKSDAAVHVFGPQQGTVLRRLAPTCPDEDEPYWYKEATFFQPGAGQDGRVIFLFDCTNISRFAQSWDLAGGGMVWQAALPEELGSSIESSLLGRDALYLNTYDGLFKLSLDGDGAEPFGQALNADYDLVLLAESGDHVIVRARRTRGSIRYELWALDGSGRQAWSYVMAIDSLLGVDSGSADGVYWLNDDGIALLEVLDDPDEVTITTLDLQSGQVVDQSSRAMEWASLDGSAGSSQAIYLTLSNKVYVVDRAGGELEEVWP